MVFMVNESLLLNNTQNHDDSRERTGPLYGVITEVGYEFKI
jgi:hypothetical protein